MIRKSIKFISLLLTVSFAWRLRPSEVQYCRCMHRLIFSEVWGTVETRRRRDDGRGGRGMSRCGFYSAASSSSPSSAAQARAIWSLHSPTRRAPPGEARVWLAPWERGWWGEIEWSWWCCSWWWHRNLSDLDLHVPNRWEQLRFGDHYVSVLKINQIFPLCKELPLPASTLTFVSAINHFSGEN